MALTSIALNNARVATLAAGGPYGLVERGAILIEGERIAWVGPESELPEHDAETIDLKGRLVTPGLIDCHTHLVFGGDRAAEFEMRLEGATYEEIARSGGGILSTVAATRAASEEELTSAARPRLEALLAEGVTTVEIKSGYGLETATECRMLRVARRLGEELPVDVRTTFLGAHALPPEDRDDRSGYVGRVVDEMLPAVVGDQLADAVDGFCESIAFSVGEMSRVFAAARDHGLPVKLHAEQLSNQGGAKLAARFRALSADHLEYLDAAGVDAMAASGTAAVLLPGAFYYLGEARRPPVAELKAANVPIAVATDLNPGSSPLFSLLAAMNMACVLFGLTPEDALRGVTVNAARALALEDRGVIARGMRADLAVWNVTRPGALAYPLGLNPCAAVVQGGRFSRGAQELA